MVAMAKRPVIDPASLRKLQARRESLRGMHAFPYSEDLASVMEASVYTCLPGESVKAAVKEMARRGVSSVVVVDRDGRPEGILTEKDVIRRLAAADGLDLEKTPVSKVMTPSPVALSPGDNVWRALSVFSSRRIKHLPLLARGKVAGMVTLRQLLKLRYPEPMTLIEGIASAQSLEDLGAIRRKLPETAASKMGAGVRACDVVVMVSLVNQDVHRRALELVMQKMGEPPLPFCLFLTGSHGRMENLLRTDQDHGLIIADSRQWDRAYDQYFMELTREFSESLLALGFAWCPGYVMSMNPTWRKSSFEWKLQLQYWFERQVPALVRYLTVFYDAAPAYGDFSLFEGLSEFAFDLLERHHEALRVLREEESAHKAPTGFMGRFITEKSGEHRGEMDIKRSGLIFVVEGVRLLALLHGVRETSTLKRIAALVDQGFLHPDDGEYFEAAYRFLLHFALSAQVDKYLGGRKIDTFINPGTLSPRDREVLRHAFKAVASLQDLVAAEFGELVL
jgi:CBS domain-containing protein